MEAFTMFRKVLGPLFSKRRTPRRQRVKPVTRRNRLLLEALEDRMVPSAVIWTDKPDYLPGETALISGAGFAVGAEVGLRIYNEDVSDGGSGNAPWFVTDGGEGDLDGVADGNFQTT